MSKQWDNKNIQTLDEITTYNNLFVEIKNASYAATFRSNPSAYAYNWQIIFTPDTHQIWTQGDFYGISSEDFTGAINELKSYYAAISAVIGDRTSSFAYQHPELIGDGVSAEDASVITTVENYLYSYISKEIDKLDKELTSSYTSVTHEAYNADNAYVTVSYVHDDETGTAYTVELHNAAADSYLKSAYSYIETQYSDIQKQIEEINKDITATSVNVITPEKVENKAYLDVTYSYAAATGTTYTVTLVDAVSAHDMESYVQSAVTYTISYIVNGAPTYFDTLKEIAEWISNDDTGAAAITNEIGYLKDAYTYFTGAYTNTQDAYTYFTGAYTNTQENLTTLNNAYTYFTAAYTNTQENLTTLNNAYTYFGEAYTYTLDKFKEIEDNSFVYVSYDGTNKTPIKHGGTIVVSGDTVNGVKWTDTTNGGNQATGSINDAIEALENRIHTAEGDGIQQISSPNGSITGEKNGTTYTLETDASKIKTTAAGNHFANDVSVQTALESVDAQVNANKTNIEAILEALNWTIVN